MKCTRAALLLQQNKTYHHSLRTRRHARVDRGGDDALLLLLAERCWEVCVCVCECE